MNESQKFAFLAEIHDRSGVPQGMGILIAGDRVLTCAHVINLALGRNSDEVDRPNDETRIDVRFPFRPGCTRKGTVLHWHPPNGGQAASDCGVLALRSSVEPEIDSAIFIDSVPGTEAVLSRRTGEESPLDWVYGKVGEPTTGGLYQVNKSQEDTHPLSFLVAAAVQLSTRRLATLWVWSSGEISRIFTAISLPLRC